jgi:V8-like Glu-specific endopeptidase
LAQQLVAPESANQEGVEPSAVGSTGQRYPYTISRLYPCVGSNCPSSGTFSNIWDFYPYTIVGQLFFTEPGVGNFVCSASVIRLSVIATAGHCVSDGHSHFFTNWLFIPAYHEGLAPFGRFTWCQATTTTNWFSGGGTVPNKQDDALIVLSNPEASNGSASCASTRSPKIGNLTGYLGYEFNAPLPTHLTQLGYPCNLDSCSDPIRDDSQVFSGPNGNFEWGTAAFGGASGGPEIQDFGQALKGGPPPTLAFGGNILISSTSYTYNNTAVQVDGGSILQPAGFPGNGFGDLINTVCGPSNKPTGNC